MLFLGDVPVLSNFLLFFWQCFLFELTNFSEIYALRLVRRRPTMHILIPKQVCAFTHWYNIHVKSCDLNSWWIFDWLFKAAVHASIIAVVLLTISGIPASIVTLISFAYWSLLNHSPRSLTFTRDLLLCQKETDSLYPFWSKSFEQTIKHDFQSL